LNRAAPPPPSAPSTPFRGNLEPAVHRPEDRPHGNATAILPGGTWHQLSEVPVNRISDFRL
jgi:hypothetical protein